MKYLFIIILLVTTVSVPAQIINNYGFKLGYVSSSQTYSGFELDNSIKRKSGYSFGAFVDIFNFNGFSLSPEIKYIQKGCGLEMVLTGPEGPEPIGKKIEYVYHNYLSIPIFWVYKIQLIAGIPFLKIAPRYDILLNSYDDFNSPASTYDNYKNVFGGTLSAGFIPKLNIAITPFIEISYHMDFTNTYSGVNNKIKNNALEVCVGLILP
ncbi:MAG: hypothetical protein A2057_09535 [Ignavibacteria bacterium GWA2_35_9]|nr:MAG: hypothetical protein A2057_09535 [Ignavibacteria bacterium GWA2_35_9]OGU46066.1 MAG: hypothetical protein A2000_03730 [Ignavibacteria bacterium GWB2_36_8]OGU51768.1 MAG: hypothetical protein A2080_13565 [Ignavibacteria bacterium GWC2_36_12]